MRRLLCAIGALALTAGVAGASTVTSGLRGTVYAMPGGACLADDDCTKKPLADATLVFSAAGRTGARAVTRADGSYRVRLAPGTYNVRLGQAGMRIVPTRASVVQGQMKTLRFVVATPHIP
jgi:hypothetical protein